MEKQVEYEAFRDRLYDTLDLELEGLGETSVSQISGCDGRTIDAYFITMPGRKAPNVFYPSYFYQKYRGGTSIPEIVENIKDCIRWISSDDISEEDLSDFECAKSHIVPKLISGEGNRDWVSNVVHLPYLDMMIVFVYVVRAEGDEFVSFTISENMLSDWGITRDELLDAAIESAMELFPLSIDSIEDVLGLSTDEFRQTFYVMTNTRRHLGAAAMLYHNALLDFANRLGGGFSVIPSSIHEVLLIPDSLCISQSDLKQMLQDVNGSVVRPDEVLSEKVYHFDGEGKGLVLNP